MGELGHHMFAFVRNHDGHELPQEHSFIVTGQMMEPRKACPEIFRFASGNLRQ
jgi:hypothetical protein